MSSTVILSRKYVLMPLFPRSPVSLLRLADKRLLDSLLTFCLQQQRQGFRSSIQQL